MLNSAPARTTDPHTSHSAISASRIGELQRQCLIALSYCPEGLTSEEIAALTDNPLQSITPRLSPLAELGLVFRQGTRPGKSGSKRIIWHLKR